MKMLTPKLFCYSYCFYFVFFIYSFIHFRNHPDPGLHHSVAPDFHIVSTYGISIRQAYRRLSLVCRLSATEEGFQLFVLSGMA